jgi:ribonuclease VapC
MIVDSSAVIAITIGERTSRELLEKLYIHQIRLISAPSVVGCYAVARRSRSDLMTPAITPFIRDFGLAIVAFDEEQARIAADAYALYGRCSGHPANLNLGDTFSLPSRSNGTNRSYSSAKISL